MTEETRSAAERLLNRLEFYSPGGYDSAADVDLMADALTAARSEGEAKGREQGLRGALAAAQKRVDEWRRSYNRTEDYQQGWGQKLCAVATDEVADDIKSLLAPAGEGGTRDGD